MGTAVSNIGRAYNEAKVPLTGGMTASGLSSASSMFSDLAQATGYHIMPDKGAYIPLNGVEPDKDYVAGIYAEASARGLNPVDVANERKAQLEWEMTADAGQMWAQRREDRAQPIMIGDRAFTKGQVQDEADNGYGMVGRYVPKFMEHSKDKT